MTHAPFPTLPLALLCVMALHSGSAKAEAPPRLAVSSPEPAGAPDAAPSPTPSSVPPTAPGSAAPGASTSAPATEAPAASPAQAPAPDSSATPSAPTTADAPLPSTDPGAAQLVPRTFTYSLNPIYPLWEGTGYVLREGEVYVGTAFVQVSLVEGLHIGIRPLSYFFRAPNAHLKWRFLEREVKGRPMSAAVQLEGVMLMRGASEAFTSTNFVSRLDNAESDLSVVPLSASATWTVRPWLNLHGTATATTVFGGRTFKTKSTLGTVFAAELGAPLNHSLFFHFGEVGYWDHDFTMFGASYRYQRGIFEGRLGYLFRFTEEGRQGAPLLSFGLHI